MKKRMVSAILLGMLLAIMVCPQLNVSLIVPVDATEGHAQPNFSADTGTYFEVNNSQHLNVTITSTATVQVVLATPYEMIDYLVESTDGADSTTLTLGNLQPSTTYYMYEDSLMNEVVFETDSEGSHTYAQDLTQPHRILIQPTAATTHINVDTTLTSDIIGSVVICANDIVLDLNGFSIISPIPWSGVGVSIGGKTGVTVKNGIIDGFSEGVSIGSSNTLDGVTIRNCMFGILLFGNNHNTIKCGSIENSWCHGIGVWGSTGNEIYGNTISGNEDDGIFMLWSIGGNRIYHNNFIGNTPMNAESWWGSPDIWDDGYPSGGNYWDDYGGVDSDGDGIGDTPYLIYDSGQDNYPLMNPWTCSIGAIIDVDPNTLNLKSNGQWMTAYITLPEGYNVEDILLETVAVDGISAEWSEIQDGVYMAKFDRASVQSTLTSEPDYESAPKFYDIELTITGTLAGGTPFIGSDTITVIKK